MRNFVAAPLPRPFRGVPVVACLRTTDGHELRRFIPDRLPARPTCKDRQTVLDWLLWGEDCREIGSRHGLPERVLTGHVPTDAEAYAASERLGIEKDWNLVWAWRQARINAAQDAPTVD